MLQGERIVLRPVRRSDITPALNWLNDPEVTQYLNMWLPLTEMREEKVIEDLGTTRAQNNVVLIIEVNDDGEPKPIGSVELEDINYGDRVAMFGITVGEKDYWNQGYGTEAARLIIRYGFEQLNLHRINSYAYSFNERSLRLHRKVGFVEEGRQREAVFKNGVYYDHVLFGILKNEWLALRNAA